MDVPTPSITDRAAGHIALCPVCATECEVVVTDVPYIDEAGVERGRTSDYDLSAYVTHYQAEHPDA
jgi:hypothetical protein